MTIYQILELIRLEAISKVCITVLLILCIGDPDILDGLIKQLNK